MVEEQIKVSLVGEDAGLGAATVTGSKNLDRFGKSIDDVNKKLPQLTRQQSTATQSMINLSRIAQDAPYGFIGIANNLNPMLESFQRLQVEAGGSQAALKVMLGSLTGPAGIGLALGVVSSLLVTFGKDIFGAGKETEDAGHKFDFFTDKINDVKDALADVNTQIDQMAKLGSINIEINGLNKSLDLEGQVVDLAQKAANARKAYSDMGDTILEIQSKLDESGKNGKLLVTGKDRDDLEAKLKQATDAQRKANEDAIKYEGERVVAERSVALQKKKEREDAAKDADEAHKKDLAALKKRNKEILDEEKRAAAERKKLMDALRTGTIDFNSPTDFFKDLNKEEALKSNPDYEKLLKRSLAGIVVKPHNVTDTSKPLISSEDLDRSIALSDNLKVIAPILTDAITPAFEGMFEAIRAGESPMKAFFDSLGQSVDQLISKLIAAAAQAAILSLIAPGGGSFTSIFAKVLGFSEGGIVPGSGNSDTVPAMLTPGELVVPKDQVQKFTSLLSTAQLDAVNTGILPDSINTSLSRINFPSTKSLENLGTGSDGPQVIFLAQRLRGRDAVLQQERERKSQRRGA